MSDVNIDIYKCLLYFFGYFVYTRDSHENLMEFDSMFESVCTPILFPGYNIGNINSVLYCVLCIIYILCDITA